MQFKDNLRLTEENVRENKEKRLSFKLLGNSMLGKFSQRSQYSQNVFVNSQDEMEKYFAEHEVIDVLPISEKVCELEILTANGERKPRSGNCIIGAFVTAYARIELHKDLMSLFLRGYELYYADTDAIIFTDPLPAVSRPLPLSLSPCFGDYKHELGPQSIIQTFACLARKSYSISFLNQESNTEEISIKSSGLSLSSNIVKKCISSKDFEVLLQNWHEKEMTVEIPQLRKVLNRKDRTINHKISNHHISNTIDIQRVVDSIMSETLPFGYTEK